MYIYQNVRKVENGGMHLQPIASAMSPNFGPCTLFAQLTNGGATYGYVIGKSVTPIINHEVSWSWGRYFTPIGFDKMDYRKALRVALKELKALERGE